jgi:D-alanyl-D-alanine carboxypeptidase (penicillin-binding protein 5/6)
LAIESPAPYVTASSWIIVESRTGQTLFAKNENESRQVASLTKIMTAHIVLKLLTRFGLNEHFPTISVLKSSTRLLGTSADLLPHDSLSAWELLHGMMLPSGNDAAQSLAIYFGLILLKDRCRYLPPDDPIVS